MLEGVRLDDQWRVCERVMRSSHSSGGCHSVSYVVEDNDGRRAFLKAIDFSAAFEDPDFTFKLQAMLEAFNFEVKLLERCRNKNFDRIVTALRHGTVRVPGQTVPVSYLITELADGDLRGYIDFDAELDVAWALRALHYCAVAVSQLHGQQIAHLDIKPSNALMFGKVLKVTDLGSAVCRYEASRNDVAEIPGDHSYAPPEFLYGSISPDWYARRFAWDVYSVGSMAVFIFVSVGMTSLLDAKLDESFSWRKWYAGYELVLPYVLDAFDRAMVVFANSLAEKNVDLDLNVRLVGVVRELCNPDPARRGHPKSRASIGNPYSLERHISELNELARRAELKLTGEWRR